MGILDVLKNFFGGTVPTPNRISINELAPELEKLREGKTKFDFFGITSNGTDCIYFVRDGSLFQIEYEAMSEDQVPYIEKLIEFSTAAGYKTSMTTYGNKPNYDSVSEAPVLRIETSSDTNKMAEIAKAVQSMIFNNNEETEYDVVP